MTEPVQAQSIRKGDVIVHDGRHVTVTEAPLRTWYYEDGERVCGLEIATSADGSGWSSRWALYRAHDSILHRVRAL